MNTQTIFESGATSHAVNDLILFTDTTREVSEIKDRIFSNGHNDKLDNKTLAATLEQLFNAAKTSYCKEFRTSCEHIRNIDYAGMKEFISLYVAEFADWVKDNSPMYQLTHEGKVIYEGLENYCYYKLQRHQGHSADWAMKYEGYKIEPIS